MCMFVEKFKKLMSQSGSKEQSFFEELNRSAIHNCNKNN